MKNYILSDVISDLLAQMDIDSIRDYAFQSLYEYYDNTADEDEIQALIDEVSNAND